MAHRQVRALHQRRVVWKFQLEVLVRAEECARVVAEPVPNKGRLLGAQLAHKVLEVADDEL